MGRIRKKGKREKGKGNVLSRLPFSHHGFVLSILVNSRLCQFRVVNLVCASSGIHLLIAHLDKTIREKHFIEKFRTCAE